MTGSRRQVGENGRAAILICIRQIVIDLLEVELQKGQIRLTNHQIQFLETWSLSRDIPIGGIYHALIACQRLR